MVAAYSALMLAALKAFGQRGPDYAPLPKWRRSAKRPSYLDLITLLRKEVAEHPELLEKFATTRKEGRISTDIEGGFSDYD